MEPSPLFRTKNGILVTGMPIDPETDEDPLQGMVYAGYFYTEPLGVDMPVSGLDGFVETLGNITDAWFERYGDDTEAARFQIVSGLMEPFAPRWMGILHYHNGVLGSALYDQVTRTNGLIAETWLDYAGEWLATRGLEDAAD